MLLMMSSSLPHTDESWFRGQVY